MGSSSTGGAEFSSALSGVELPAYLIYSAGFTAIKLNAVLLQKRRVITIDSHLSIEKAKPKKLFF